MGRRCVVGGAVVLVLGVLLGWWWLHGRVAVPAPQTAPPALAVLAAPGAAVPAASAPTAATVVAPAPVRSRAEPDCRVSEAPLAKLRAAVAALRPDDAASSALMARIEAEDRRADQAGMAAHRAAVATLRASADPLRRAAGLYAAMLGLPSEVPPCEDNKGCAEAIRRTGGAYTPGLAELATQARDGTSAQVYAWALHACGTARYQGWSPAACEGLSAQRWAQLAPQSAWPWLALADEARKAGDLSGEVGAMHRAAQATQWRSNSGELLRLLLAAQPPDQTPQVRLRSEARAVVIDSLASFSSQGSLLGVSRHCSAHQDANRRQTCAAIADRLLGQADSLVLLAVAIGVSERSGVPAARIAAARDEAKQLPTLAVDWEPLLSASPATACEGLARASRYIASMAALGELGALREQLAASAPAARR